ncbi:DUF4112 domain-containing protein [Pelagicoccus sp. SDUM812003]|uniref:DUF4112 domain-containing protein n=1 Tax=Pelagicoccus sp. SDUM812003 TaxID=3041267 RepID=UPI00280F67DA|nr:DUF4112 domain-containing protein [Pelagicoccus sp. SDUM812003]MDQ8203982.1 DUF4112 domain-containing protein [Pelagicoccus sp. SDUM812003]
MSRSGTAETVEVTRMDEQQSKREEIERLQRIAHFFDSAFAIPGTSLRIGWDSIIGLIPGVGDLIGMAPLAFYLRLARKYRLGGGVYARLIANQGLDFVLGTIPVVGDLFDWGFKANARNAKLLIERLEA